MQTCIGCGAQAERHPFIGVGRQRLETGDGPMVDHPVCNACYLDPAHRSSPLKLTYFHVDASSQAVAAARVLDAKSRAGADLSLGR
jgi:hypothetical protein